MKFPIVFSVLLFTAGIATSAPRSAPTTPGLTETEQWIVAQVNAGNKADLRQKSEGERQLRARFVEQLITETLPGVTPQRTGIYIIGASIPDDLDLTSARINHSVKLEHCTFVGFVYFMRTRLGELVSFNNSTFKKAAFFCNLKVENGLYFTHAVFESDANFLMADIGAGFNADDAQFNSKTVEVDLGMKCAGTGFFRRVTFAGPVSFKDSNFVNLIIGDNPDASPAPDISLLRASIKQQLSIRKVSIEKLDASLVRVEGLADFADLKVKDSANFSQSDFATLDLSRSVWPTKAENFQMQGMRYRYLRADLKEPRSHEVLLGLANQSRYSADVYTNLEAFLSSQGYKADADRVFIAGKRRERNENLHGFDWIGSWLLDWLVGYGRHPWQAGVPCAFFVALGCLLFSPKKMEPQNAEDAPRIYNRLWYSLGLFLPFVDLQSSKVWKPQNDQRFLRHYMRLHILLGWILIPILLAAITGFIK